MSARIKHGTTRVVFLLGRYAIKVPTNVSWKLFLCGLLGNMQEVQFSPLSAKLCPVTFSIWGGFLVVMKRAEPITREQFFAIETDWFEEGDLSLPVEFKQCSFGVLDGQLVAVDYGS